MYSVILCGGAGTRLWPLSRKNFPKQFLNLFGKRTLIQETYSRMRKIMPKENIFFITNKDGFFNVANQIIEIEKEYNKDQIFIEPKSQNTAPAIALAMKFLEEKFDVAPENPIIFLPSDHYIKNVNIFIDVVKNSLDNVDDHIGTIGIKPTGPNTAYGYMKKGEKNEHSFKALEFKEKPNEEKAKEYLTSGDFVWNSGMYIFNRQTFTRELKKYCPEIYEAANNNLETFLKKFADLPAISIDYAISEKSDNTIIFEGDFGWNDVGSFDSISEISENIPNKKHIAIDSKNIFIHSNDNRVVATIGVDDLNIIETADSILIQKKGRGEDVKKITAYLAENNLKELEHILLVHRPWGKYELLIDDPNHKVKKITVYPGAKLSLQAHNHRAEHWVVVKGTAKVTNGDKEIFLFENESTYIPKLARHRLENTGKMNLEIIEVQTGTYLEEDDIIRFDDIYNR